MNYQFSIIVDANPKNHDEILDVADAFGEAGCLDASLSGHGDGIEAGFDREAPSLDSAIHSAITAIEGAEFKVKRVEMSGESIMVET